MVQQKLDAYKADDPAMGQGPDKSKSMMIILDRGFDAITPLLHELTFQAMAYDLLPIENDVYRYEDDAHDGATKEVLLDENDSLWAELRHQHIADVIKKVTTGMKQFMSSKKQTSDKMSVKDLADMIKKMPEHQKELNRYSVNLHMAEVLMKIYREKEVEKVCRAEQDLAMGETASGEKVRDAMRAVVPVLLDSKYTNDWKLRAMLLFILSKSTGVPTENVDKLFQHAQIDPAEKQVVTNVQNLGLAVYSESKKKSWEYKRKERSGQTYDLSRWTPVVKDIIEDAMDGKLSAASFPALGGGGAAGIGAVGSARQYGQWINKGGQPKHSGPRLIVFIAGGVTYSEMRVAYEVTAAYKQKNWDIVVGGSHVLTPSDFVNNLRDLDKLH